MYQSAKALCMSYNIKNHPNMARTSIAPIRVIEQLENGDRPATAEIRTIVAIDEEADKAWDSQNRLYALSEIETWNRPQDDVFSQPIVIPSVTTTAADGSVVSEVIAPVQRVVPIAPVSPATTSPTTSPITSPIEPVSHIPAYPAQQPSAPADDMLHQLIKRLQPLEDDKTVVVDITAAVDVNHVLAATRAFGYNEIDTLKALIDCDLVTSVNVHL